MVPRMCRFEIYTLITSTFNQTRPYIASSILGCWLTDPLNHFFGRRGTLFWCGIFCTFSVIGQGFAQTWPQLFVRPTSYPRIFLINWNTQKCIQVCRLLLGLGMGPKATTSPVFAAENTPANIRGGLVMSWQLWVNLLFYYLSHRHQCSSKLLI